MRTTVTTCLSSQISYIAADVLKACYVIAVGLLNGTLKGGLEAGDVQQFSCCLVLLTFLQVRQEIVSRSGDRLRRRCSASISIALVFTPCLPPITFPSDILTHTWASQYITVPKSHCQATDSN